VHVAHASGMLVLEEFVYVQIGLASMRGRYFMHLDGKLICMLVMGVRIYVGQAGRQAGR